MLKNDVRVSLAELSEAGIRLRPVDAVTIVRELALQIAGGALQGIPSAQVIRLSGAGSIGVEGPVAAGGGSVSRAAQLLESLLPGFDAPAGYRVTGSLRLVIARAQGAIDLPPYPSLESFCDALARFAAPDPAAAIRELVACWSAAAAVPRGEDPRPAASEPSPKAPAEFPQAGETAELGSERTVESAPPTSPEPVTTALVPAEAAPLTISDIRRARRATGLALAEISARSRIPVPMLRQLEWGYLRHWPAGLYGRTQLVRYARAAGLDEQLVIATVWPMVAEQGRGQSALSRPPVEVREEPQPDPDVVPAVEVHDATIIVDEIPLDRAATFDVDPMTGTNRKRTWALAALAIPALLALALWPAVSVRMAHWNLPMPSSMQVRRTPPPAAPPAQQPRDTTTVAVDQDGAAKPQPATDDAAAPRSGSREDREAGTSGETSVAASAHREEGLTNDEVAYSPAFATVGSAMFYHAEDADGGSALMRADTNAGGTVLRITRVVDDSSRNFHARPSPDGAKIAFDSDREGLRAVYVADSNGEHVRRVSGDGFAAVPSWSPDGRTLAFVRAEPNRPRVWNVWTVDLDSGELRRITDRPYGQPWGASWFPDGRRIAYSHEDRLIVRDLESGRERVYTSPRKGRLVRTPAVSPDGRRVIFQVYRDGAWLLDLADGSTQKILADPTAEEYTWSPDGRRVAYHSRQSGQWGVWVMAAR